MTSMDTKHIALFSEHLRPKTISDLTLQQHLVDRFERMVASRSIINMLFFGRAGAGKTSAARILLSAIDADVYELNGSHNNGDKRMINGITEFASSMSLELKPKVIFIDEADGLSSTTQESLRYFIEKFNDNARFILTANEPKRLSDAIRSRCNPICFDPPFGQSAQIVERMTPKYVEILKTFGVEADASEVKKIMIGKFPDMRAIANALEFRYL